MGSSSRTFFHSTCGIDGCDKRGTLGITVGGGKGPPPGYMGGFYCSRDHADQAEVQLKAQEAREREAYEVLRDRLAGRGPLLLISKRKTREALSWLARSSGGW